MEQPSIEAYFLFDWEHFKVCQILMFSMFYFFRYSNIGIYCKTPGHVYTFDNLTYVNTQQYYKKLFLSFSKTSRKRCAIQRTTGKVIHWNLVDTLPL